VTPEQIAVLETDFEETQFLMAQIDALKMERKAEGRDLPAGVSDRWDELYTRATTLQEVLTEAELPSVSVEVEKSHSSLYHDNEGYRRGDSLPSPLWKALEKSPLGTRFRLALTVMEESNDA
jgi:hypothetical protein